MRWQLSDFLERMAAASSARAATSKRRHGMDELSDFAAQVAPPIPLHRHPSGFDVIAEIKLSSPSVGRIAPSNFDLAALESISDVYLKSGAVSISVLTEESRFEGSLEHLSRVARSVDVPVMCKDFLVDPIQVLEARASGGSGVLLIARMLSATELGRMTDLALSLGMFVLVEVFEPEDLDVASVVFDRDVLLGVNCRDLTTLDVNFARFERMKPLLPDHLGAVAESGMRNPDQVAHVAAMGYGIALVGSALVAASDPGGSLERMIETGRAAKVGIGV